MTDLPLASEFPAATQADWRARVAAVLKGADFERRLVSPTLDGFAIQPLYARSDGGPRALRGQAGPWRIVQRVDMPAPEAAARQALDDLEGGADALAFALPGARAARGYGVDAETVADLDAALAGVRLDLIHTRLEPAPGGRLNAAALAALVARRGHDPAALDMEFGLDPIGTFAASGTLVSPWEEIGRRLAEAVTALSARGFRGPFLLCDARPFHEAGASEAQELAAALAAGVAYLRALEAQGIAPGPAREALAFLLVADSDEFLTVAKFRALRRLWARVEEACGLAPAPIRLHAETAWRSATRRDPHVNMLRAAIACFSAGVGGADTVGVLPFTAALGLPDPFARRVARNAQLILIGESNLARVADPAAGAGGFEAMTEALCEAAWSLFQEVEREGGLVAALAAGGPQARIAATRVAREKAVATRRLPITGTSEFPHLAEAVPAVLDAAPAPRRPRAPLPAGGKLDFAGMIDAIAGGAPRTALAPQQRQALACTPLPSARLAEPFEALRDASDAALARDGARPRVFLACLGSLAAFTPRATFARNLFEAGGIEAPANAALAGADGATDLAALADAFRASGARIACLCGADETYAAEAVAAARTLAAAGAAHLHFAGRPGEIEAALHEAGVEAFVFIGIDVLAALRSVHAELGLSARIPPGKG